MRNVRDGLGERKYELLSDFMTTLTVLPHSSAAVERVFSQMNMVKTKQTNKLSADSVRDRLLAKQAVSKGNCTCATWTPSKRLVDAVSDGTCHKRYMHKFEIAKQQRTVTLEEAVDVNVEEI